MRQETGWFSSPACARILEVLECRGPNHKKRLAADAHTSLRNCMRRMSDLEASNIIHVDHWELIAGHWFAIYMLGPGISAPAPIAKPGSRALANRQHRGRLVDRFGKSIANRILSSKQYGTERIVIDGRAVYERGRGVLA